MDQNSSTTITCKNCGNVFLGNYCSNCSQSATTSRITWKKIFDMLIYGIFHVNKGLPFTIKEMLIRPGEALNGYVSGKRVNYFNPFLYLLIAAALNLSLFETGEFKLITKQVNLKYIEAFSSYLSHHFFLVPALFFLILFSLTDTFLFRKYKFNFPELLVINTYCMATVMVIVMLFVPILYVQQLIVLKWDVLIKIRPYIKFVLLAYIVFARIQFFSAKKNIRIILKILVQVFAIYLLYELFISGAEKFLESVYQ